MWQAIGHLCSTFIILQIHIYGLCEEWEAESLHEEEWQYSSISILEVSPSQASYFLKLQWSFEIGGIVIAILKLFIAIAPPNKIIFNK